MRCRVSLISLLVVLLGSSVLLGEGARMPYKAYVVSDGVYVRSGPGKNYYPTTKLPAGAEVEVYRHDPGGWYAIRPPQDSFTWVAARYVEVGEDGLGTVTGEQVAARVGTNFSDIRDVIQVRLSEGELVEILGEKQFTGTSEAGKWYKIAPPSGEFRWVFGRLVDPDYMTSGVREAPNSDSPLLVPPRPPVRDEQELEEPVHLSDLEEPSATPDEEDFAVIEPEVLDLSEQRLGPSERERDPEARQAAWISADGAPANPGDPKPIRAERVAAHEETIADDADETDRPSSSEGRKTVGYVSPRIPELNEPEEEEQAIRSSVDRPLLPFEETLDRLELELSRMLAEEPTVWRFTELEIQAQSLLQRARTALERGKVRLLLKKIAQSEDVRRRYIEFVDSEVQLDRRERQLEALDDESETQNSGAEPVGMDRVARRYDGQGRLGRLVTSEPDAPRFALVDESGKLKCYVTPAPGLNLGRYVGTRIGVVGTAGYIPKRQARHVMAKHVTPLETARR